MSPKNSRFSFNNKKDKLRNKNNYNKYSNTYKKNTMYSQFTTPNRTPYILKKISTILLKVIITIFLIGVITGSIVVTALTVYVMKYVETDTDIDIRNLKSSSSTSIYSTDPNTGEDIEIEKIYSNSNRLWVDLDKIPQSVRDAFIYTEDERFFQHEGVDWKRTFAAFANLFLHFYDTKQGGSTITQQLIKNITGEDQIAIDRKIQEIFKAMNLERHYSKNEILEGYLNIVHLANNTDGVGAAAIYYFNKDISQLDVVEAAALAAMTRNPSRYDPIANPANNKERRKYVLSKMLEFKAITQEEYNTYSNQDLKINKGGTVRQQENKGVQSYFVDHLMNELIERLAETKNFTKESAEAKIYNGGLKIYSTANPEIQKLIEQKYNDYTSFSSYKVNNPPQSAMVVMNYNGQIQGLIGGRGAKSGNRVFNRATQSKRSPGSTMKPIGVYASAIEKNITTWSSLYQDSPIQIVENGKTKYWPQNYGGARYPGSLTTNTSLQRSLNTVPVRILQKLTPTYSFNFLQEKLGITTLVKDLVKDGITYSDETLSGMSLGGLTYGLYLHELTATYQIFGNKGYYYKPTTLKKVVDSSGKVLLENNPKAVTAISEETAGVMNKLLQQVVEGPYGTGRAAKLSNMTVIGKTGTSENENDQLFIGATPSYVAGIWLGYDTPAPISPGVAYSPPQIWKNILGNFLSNDFKKEFTISEKVKNLKYCTVSGLIATKRCYSTADGYYKESYIPSDCNIH